MHKRKLIREAVRLMLLNKTAAANRVYKTRKIPWRPNELPAIAIYTLTETVDEESKNTAPRELKRLLTLVIECGIKADDQIVSDNGEALDDALDDVAEQVEIALSRDDTLTGTASDAWLAGTEMDILTIGDEQIGIIALKFSVEYYTLFPESQESGIDDFNNFQAVYKVEPDMQDEDAATDLLTDIQV